MFLIGTSRGTISVASVILKGQLAEIKGVILTSSVVGNSTFQSLDLENISTPTTFIHHLDDSCQSSSFDQVYALWKKLDRTVFNQLVQIHGGSAASKDPCAARTKHGFWRSEAEVLAAANSWILSRLK